MDLRETLRAARAELHGLCDGSRKFTMSVPPRMGRDSDMLISAGLDVAEAALDELDALKGENARLVAMCNPDQSNYQRILNENDTLKAENAEADALNTKLSRILTDTAHALKGTPEALHSHSWADLAQVAAKLVDERDTLRAQLADLRERAGKVHEALRNLWCLENGDIGAGMKRAEHMETARNILSAPGFLDAKEGGR